jgi:hypothetical protein
MGSPVSISAHKDKVVAPEQHLHIRSYEPETLFPHRRGITREMGLGFMEPTHSDLIDILSFHNALQRTGFRSNRCCKIRILLAPLITFFRNCSASMRYGLPFR